MEATTVRGSRKPASASGGINRPEEWDRIGIGFETRVRPRAGRARTGFKSLNSLSSQGFPRTVKRLCNWDATGSNCCGNRDGQPWTVWRMTLSELLLIKFKNGHEGFLGNIHFAHGFHAFFAFRLLLQQFFLTGDVSTITFC